ncbi:alpha/beta fold hydrolase [Streptomyces lavendulae]|uniref:alpha/beta fold hydrolase n=1 Tax=Streptomyces lavendulae TaxID=1914 RepID=UPI00368058A3
MSPRHSLRWWTSGNLDAPHLLILHGGPGGRSSVQHRTLTDPSRWHITQFDQRGCGESEPRGCCHDNGMDQTVLDIERLREHLGVTSWAVLGPSWGSTVALAYAARFPGVVDALVLTGLFIGTRADKSFLREGFGAPPRPGDASRNCSTPRRGVMSPPRTGRGSTTRSIRSMSLRYTDG